MSQVRRVVIAGSGLLFALTGAISGATPVAAAAAPAYLLKTGADAAAYTPPADLCQVFSWVDTHAAGGAMTFTRYQQRSSCAINNGVDVAGAQVTVASQNGQKVVVAGMYAPSAPTGLKPSIGPAQAISIAANSASQKAAMPDQANDSSAKSATHSAKLMLNPDNNRLFYKVTSAAPGSVIYTSVDATTGAVIESLSGIFYDDPPASGTGVKGDTKKLDGTASLAGDIPLTSGATGSWSMSSASTTDFSAGRYLVTNANSGNSYGTSAMTDTDDQWVGVNQKAAVDAQYYAALTDNYYLTKRGFDLPACLGANEQVPVAITPIHSVVHYKTNYANAFWDEDQEVMAYGDGDGSDFSQMSGAQDVVSHELTHAVTSCRAPLDYQKESGALNEAFSDIMGTAAEFEKEENLATSHCKLDVGQTECADWWLGEDLIIGGSDHAIRSLAHPQLLGQPSHWSQRLYKSGDTISCKFPLSQDYCGVHTNSGIANHAFYLTVAGGRNARCTSPSDPQADCDVVVPGMPVDDAAHIYFDAWQMLTTSATFCQARDATVAMADALYPDTTHHVDADLGWQAVGVGPCQASGGYTVGASTQSPASQPGGSASVTLAITRSSSSSAINLSVSDPAPATASFNPNGGITGTPPVSLKLDVPGGAGSGLYPMIVTADDGSTTQKLSIVLVVDSDNPTASVGRANLQRLDAVAADGHVPLHLSWTTADATSGVASGSLSVDSAQVATGVSGTSTYSSLDGTHHVVASATDVAGNTGSSTPLAVTQTSFQENQAQYVKAWTSTSSTPGWGTTRYATRKGATATLTFTGTDVAWVAPNGPKRGKAKVYVDGVLKTTVDLYAKNFTASRIVFVASGLAAGQHSIKIYVNGTSGRPRIAIDGFVVLNQ